MPSISGVIYDQSNNQPIPDALVSLSNGVRESTNTDHEGRYYVEAKTGTYTLKAIHKNYRVYRKQVEVTGKETQDIALRRG